MFWKLYKKISIKYSIYLLLLIFIYIFIPRFRTDKETYTILEQHGELASKCNIASLLWIHEKQSYNKILMTSWEKKGALCGFLYFELLFLERFKQSPIEKREKFKYSLLNEKKYKKQAEILLKKIKEIEVLGGNTTN